MYEQREQATRAQMQDKIAYSAGAVTGGGAMLGEGVQRQPEVVGELHRLGMATERLAKISETLTDRLMPIRRQTGNANQAGNLATAATPVMCGMAGSIRDRREAIERYTAQLEQAMGELEI